MLSLVDLVLIFVVLLAALFAWQHHRVRHRAYAAALRYTRFHEVLLLDESIVLKRMRIRLSHSSLFTIERLFQFEFSSLGDERYRGEVIFLGMRQAQIKLQAFKTDFKGLPLE